MKTLGEWPVDYFSKKEMLGFLSEIGELEEGQTVHLHHCKEGKNNDRLFITRTEATIHLAYCHHCGKRGFADTSDSANINTLKERHFKRSTFRGGEYKLPNDCINPISGWERKARVWIRRYGITDKEVEHYGLSYSPTDGRVVIPVYDSNGLALYQTRKIFEEDLRPKYLTYNNRHGSLWWSGDTHASNILTLCEDVISGIRLARHIPSAALLGTSISDTSLNIATSHYDSYIIFMDDDNADVRMKQLVLKNRLELFGDVRVIHTNGKDAKEHTDEELKEMLL